MATSFKKLLWKKTKSKCPKSLAKAISWEASSLVLTVCIIWAITGDLRFTLVLSAACQVAKAFAGPIHEYVWQSFTRGKEQ